MLRHIKKNPLPVVLFTVFIDLLGYGILLPVIPQLLANPTSAFYLLPKNLTPKEGFIILGFLVAIFPFMQFISTPILGQLSDKFGRKKILWISLAGTCLSYVMFAIGIISRNIPLLFISRAFDGITGGNISVAQASLADVTKPQDRAKTFGLIGAAFGIGFIIGPYIGGKLSDPSVVSWFNAATPFWFAAILSFLNLISLAFFFPETNLNRQHGLKINWIKSIKNIIHAYLLKNLRSLFATNFLFQAGFSFYTTFGAVFLIHKFGFSQGNIGDFFAYIGLWIAITQAIITRQIAKKFNEGEVLSITLFGCALAIMSYLLTTSPWQLLFLAPFFAIFMGLSQANIVGLVSRRSDPKIQGEVLGINSSVQALAQTIPAVLSGYIAADLAYYMPLVAASSVIIVSGLVFWKFAKVSS